MEKQRWEESERRSQEVKRSEKRKSEKKEDAGARKGRKVAFPMICGSGGSKSRLAKRRVRSHLARLEMKNCTRLWREAHLQVKKLKTPHVRTTFESWDVEAVYAVLGWSTFPSQNAQSTACLDHFWKLTYRKSARLCGAKHISKSKCTKQSILGPLLEVEMSKKCTALWREAHFQVHAVKNWGFWASLDVQMSTKSLTNLTNSTILTNLTNLTTLTKTTNLKNLNHKLTNWLTNWTNCTNLTHLTH